MVFVAKYLFLTFLFGWADSTEFSKINEMWIIKSSSSLEVDGSTNINNFSCKINSYKQTDTLYFSTKENEHKNVKVDGKLRVNVSDFDCQHRIMTKDLQKTLQSEKHPQMIVKFINFAEMPITIQSRSITTGDVQIELAGVKKSFLVQYSINKLNKNNIELLGFRKVNFSDFNLKPPSKLGGTIKVKNELQVEFKLQLQKYE